MQGKKRNIFPITDYVQFLEEGKTEFRELVEYKCSSEPNLSDFEHIVTLGKGAFGKVLLTKSKQCDRYYALKILEKSQLVKIKQVNYVISEKRVLQALNHPFTVHLEFAFQDNSYVYLGLPFVSGGEMFIHLNKMKKFEEPLARFYAAQIVLALEYLHYFDMVYRDLKPENIMIDNNGYLKMADFGFCKVINGRTYTLCGTPEFLAPEVILSKGYGKSVDWWSFGVLLFEMSAGHPPFMAKDPIKVIRKSVACQYSIPTYFSAHLEDLVSNLVTNDLSRRYGNLKGGIEDIKNHKWFQSINWLSLLNGYVEPPFVPTVTSPDDTRNFDKQKEIILKVEKKNQYGNLFEDF